MNYPNAENRDPMTLTIIYNHIIAHATESLIKFKASSMKMIKDLQQQQQEE